MPVAAADFELVPEELIADAVRYAAWLESNGYSLTIEPYELDYPATPIFRAARGTQQDFFYEISSAVNVGQAQEWVKFGKASSGDTRFVVAIAGGKDVSTGDLATLRQLGVGVDLISSEGVSQLCTPHDLSLNVEFPTLTRRLLPVLRDARDLFAQGNWKESYEDACLALETTAREYLRKAKRAGRASFVTTAGTARTYTEQSISRMTLGSLATAFSELAQPNQAESRVAVGLARINPNRVTVAHFKHETGERAQTLRAQVGRDFIVIVNSIDMLL